MLAAIIAAAVALLMASGVGVILLAAIAGAVVGAGLGAMVCGDLAAILRTWVFIKTDAEIQGNGMVPNRPGVHINCKMFGNQITFAPNVKNEFTAMCMFAMNIGLTGLEGFMYVYGARGAGLLLSAPKKFLFNFATNYLASLTMKGVAMRTLFAGYSAVNAYYTSPTEGFDKDRVSNAALDGGFFIERAAWRLYQGATNDGYKDPETGKTNWQAVMTDAFMMLSMGGIPAGGGGKDATATDVGNMANQVASEWKDPVGTAKAEIGKVVETAKQFREQLKKLVDGTGAHEEKIEVPPEKMTGKRPAEPEYPTVDENGNITEYGKWYYERPAWNKQTIEDVWNNAKNADNKVFDQQKSEVEITWDRSQNRGEQWHMGHKPGYEFAKHQQSAAQRGIGVEQFRSEYNTAEHVQPELPESNVSHKGEASKDVYYGF